MGAKEFVANADGPEPGEVDEASVGVVLRHANEYQTLCLLDSRLSVVVDLVTGSCWVKLRAYGPLVDRLANSCAQVDVRMIKNKEAAWKEMLRVGEVKVEKGVDI